MRHFPALDVPNFVEGIIEFIIEDQFRYEQRALEIGERVTLRHSCSRIAAIVPGSARTGSNKYVSYPFVTHPALPPFLIPLQVIHSISTTLG